MFVLFKYHFALQLLLISCMAAISGLAHASTHSMQLDDFYPNCDIRQLNLSQGQQNSLRKIRSEFKRASDKAYKKSVRNMRNRRENVIKILSGTSFDQNAARDYVETRYIPSMDFAVDELAIQYRFFQILNPNQQKLWLSSCLRR